jgi:hypothetical protein
MENQKLWLYGGAAVLALLVLSRRGGATVINRSDPNAAASSQATADFAARGLDSLASVARTDVTSATQRYVTEAQSNAQVAAERSRDAAYTAVGLANARAQKAAADASGKGKTGFSIPTPWGTFGIHF